jgi:hypothetical protein
MAFLTYLLPDGRRLVHAALLLAAATLLLAAGAQAAPPAAPPAPGKLLRLEATLTPEAAPLAVAINADESILAVGVAAGAALHVILYDRPSRAKLGAIAAEVGDHPRLRFAPNQDLLLIAGSKGLQLWEVPIVPLKPDQLLSGTYRRWEQPLPAGAAGAVGFGDPPDQVLWSADGALYSRSAAAGAVAPAKPVWRVEGSERKVAGFQLARGGSGLAVHYAGEKDVDLLDARTFSLVGTLVGHRFPVLDGTFGHGRTWLSLDQGNTLLRWNENLQAQESAHLEPLPPGVTLIGLRALGARHVLLLGDAGAGAVRALVAAPPAWKVEAEARASGVEALAVSPTGRYVLAADGGTVSLFGFAQPEAPLDYVRRLRELKAFTTAQAYVRLLDDAGLSPRAKAGLLAELNRLPPGTQLQEAQDKLRLAQREGRPEDVRRWAGEVLALAPKNAQALAALQDVKARQERAALEQARLALAEGKPAAAIALLTSQIPQDSSLRAEAQDLIHEAEAQRRMDVTLDQAREKLNLGDYPAASALAHEVLRQRDDHPAARSLLTEIQERQSPGRALNLPALVLGSVFALAIMGLIWQRMRARRATRPLAQPSTGGPHRKRAEDPGAKSAGARARTPPRPASPAAAARAGAAPARPERPAGVRLQVAEELLDKTGDMLRLARHADVAREHAAHLMGLEAELAAFRRRLRDPAADLGAVHNRLKAVAAELRALKFRPVEAAAQGERPQPVADDTPTWYELLRVAPTAPEAEIRGAYHRMLKQYHPDLHNHSDFGWVKEESERMSRLISQAFEVLGDAARRQEYDRELRRRGRLPQ